MASSDIPDSLKKYYSLLEKNPVAVLSTLMPNGYPQQTLVWFDFEGDLIRINTIMGRQKDLNMQRHPKVSMLILDPDDYTSYLEIRGNVRERTFKGAIKHLNELTVKYMGLKSFPYSDELQNRVTYKIEIKKIRPSTKLKEYLKSSS